MEKSTLESYINGRILNNNGALESIKQDFGFFASTDWLDARRFKEFEAKGWKRDSSDFLSFSKTFPIYNSNLTAKVVVYRPKEGGPQCRMFVSNRVLNDPAFAGSCEVYSGKRKLI